MAGEEGSQDLAAQAEAIPPPLGERLRHARESRDLTTEAAASALHLDPSMLRALESGDFARLGAPVFVRGHLRKYAQLLGLDPLPLLAAYTGEAAPAEPLPARELRPRERFAVDDGLNWPVVLIVLLVVLVAGLAVWRLWDQPGEPVPVSTELSQAWAVPLLTPIETTVSLRAPQLLLPAGEPDAFAGTTSEPLDPPGDGVLLSISFTGECWTEINDASGRRLYFGMARAGQRVAVRGQAPFAVVLGNAAAATLSVDGEPWLMPAAQVSNNVARLSIDPSAL